MLASVTTIDNGLDANASIGIQLHQLLKFHQVSDVVAAFGIGCCKAQSIRWRGTRSSRKDNNKQTTADTEEHCIAPKTGATEL